MACKNETGWQTGCEEDRGGAWRESRSSTWEAKGGFALGLNEALGYSPYDPERGVGDFGIFGRCPWKSLSERPLTSNKDLTALASDLIPVLVRSGQT